MATIVTKSVGTSARDYSTIAAAVAALPANLVTADQAWVFELYNDTEFNENLTLTGHTTDATRNITFRPAAGQGFGDHANKLTNALRYNQSNGVGIIVLGGFLIPAWDIGDSYVLIDGLQFHHAGGQSTSSLLISTGANVVIKNCVIQDSGAQGTGGFAARLEGENSGLINCLHINRNSAQTDRVGFSVVVSTGYIIGCGALRTVTGTGNRAAFFRDYGSPLIRNCWALGWQKFGKDTTADASSGYNATDLAAANTPGTNNVYSLTSSAQLQSVTVNSEDARVKAGSGLVVGTRDQTYTSDLDMVKSARSITLPTIGPWEYSAGGGATATTLSGPSSGTTGVASTNFTVGANGTITGTVTVTPADAGAGGTFTPTTRAISSGTPTGTFTYTPASTGVKTISISDDGGLTDATSLSYTSNAAGGAYAPRILLPRPGMGINIFGGR